MKQQKNNQQSGRTIGIDIHPSVFSAAALSGKSAQGAEVQWIHDAVQVASLEKWAKKNLQKTDIVVMEAGSNSFSACKLLSENGFHAVVLESFQASRIGQNYLKNDRVDAVKLARVYLSGLAKTVWQPDETTLVRREVLASHRQAKKDTTRHRCRIRGFLTKHRLVMPKGTPLANGTKGEQWILSARQWNMAQRTIITEMFSDLRHAEAKRKRLCSLMAREVMDDPALRRLLDLCGLRHIIIFAIAAVVGDVSRFRGPKQLVAYIGLNPRVNESGVGSKDGRLLRHGRKDLRSLLTQGAQAVLRQNPQTNKLARWGQALVFRKCKNSAVIAVARKMAVAVWYILRGFASDILSSTTQLETKLKRVGADIGHAILKQMGYPTIAAFAQKTAKEIKMQILQAGT